MPDKDSSSITALARILPVTPRQLGAEPVESVLARDLHAYLDVGRD